MKITKADITTLGFAIGILDSVSKQTITTDQKVLIVNHIKKLRKMRITIIIALNNDILDFDRLVYDGIPDNDPALIAFQKMWGKTEQTISKVSPTNSGD